MDVHSRTFRNAYPMARASIHVHLMDPHAANMLISLFLNSKEKRSSIRDAALGMHACPHVSDEHHRLAPAK